jgi:hypothetical protein
MIQPNGAFFWDFVEEDSVKNVRDLRLLTEIFLVGILSLLGCAALQAESTGISRTPERILFIGNSVSAGVNYTMENLAASASPPTRMAADASFTGSTVLEGLWSEPGSRHEQILEGKYDRVVLQATLSEAGFPGRFIGDTEQKFHEYAGKFDEEIRKGGARTVLFMHWQFDLPRAMNIEEIARVYWDVAKELGVEVAPVGLAWQRAQKERPNLTLLSDSVHSNSLGNYLAASVLYATLFKKTPVGLTYFGWGGITPEQAAFLQRVAWETVQDYTQPFSAE